MNNRAFEAGLNVFPENIEGVKKTLFGDVPNDKNEFPRMCFIAGFDQGEKSTIERAIEWLKKNCEEHIWYSEIDRDCGMDDNFYNEFRKALEGN